MYQKTCLSQALDRLKKSVIEITQSHINFPTIAGMHITLTYIQVHVLMVVF